MENTGLIKRNISPIQENSPDDSLKNYNNKEQQTSSPVRNHLENICWFGGSLLCIYLSDIFNVILYDHTIYRSLLMLALLLISANVALACYLIIWVTFINKVNSDKWTELYPLVIPVATACFVIGSIL